MLAVIAGRVILSTTAAVCLAGIAAAQPIPSSEQPGRERQRFEASSAPKARPAGPRIQLPGSVAPEAAAAVKLELQQDINAGSTVYDEPELAALYADLLGQEVSLAALYDIAQRITTKYGSDGYVLSRAVIPPQELEPGAAVVRIEVIEGYVDRVEWPGALSHYRDLFSAYEAKITADRPINVRTIERYLLLADDLPGLEIESTLRASDIEPRASTLVVTAKAKPVDVFARADNRGTEARGPEEALASVRLNNLLGWHEALTLNYAAAIDTDELQYAAVNYEQVLSAEGLTAFADASYSWGNPGTIALRTLEFHSESLYADAGLRYPLIRSRERNLTLSGLAFLSNDEGDILAATSSLDRLRGIRLAAYFDDAAEAGNITQLSATFSQGIDGLGSTTNDNPNASRASGRVDFSKLEAALTEILPLGSGLSAVLQADGQYAFTPLLASEECGYGGRDLGRAFDPSELTGDHCWEVLGELRLDLPLPQETLAPAQLYGFMDHGEVYRRAPSAGTPRREEGTSAGLGMRLGWKALSTDLSAAKPLDGRDDDDWRYFFIANARF